MGILRTRMERDLVVRGLSANTHEAYLRAVVGLTRYYNRSPDTLTLDEVQDYLVHLIEDRKLAWSSCSVAAHGLRFFYEVTLGWPRSRFYIPAPKRPAKQPDILSRQEVARLFESTANLKHRMLLMTTYAAVLRIESPRFQRSLRISFVLRIDSRFAGINPSSTWIWGSLTCRYLAPHSPG